MARLLAAALATIAAAAAAGAAAAEPARALQAEGERLYRTRCASCHRLRDPADHTRADWAWALREFGPRAHLTEAQAAAILEYLRERAADAPRRP